MARRGAEVVDITAEFRKDTGAAYMVFVGDYENHAQYGRKEKWVSLPKSMTEWNGQTTFTIPTWLCEEKGLDAYVV